LTAHRKNSFVKVFKNLAIRIEPYKNNFVELSK